MRGLFAAAVLSGALAWVIVLSAVFPEIMPDMGDDDESGPYVCPGCHAIGEPCAPGCVEEEMLRERERETDSDDWE